MTDAPKKNVKLDLVKTKSNLKKLERNNGALDEIRSKIKDLGDISQLENDPELIEQLCTWVENITKIILKGVEKQDLVVKLLLDNYPTLNNDKDIARIRKQINHIVSSGLITKVSDTAVVASSVCGFIKKCL